MGALYPFRRNLWATALCLSLILLPGAVLPDRLPRSTSGSPEARPGEADENGAAESEEARFSGEQLEVFRVNGRFIRELSA